MRSTREGQSLDDQRDADSDPAEVNERFIHSAAGDTGFSACP
jgi:hypothetical protein